MEIINCRSCGRLFNAIGSNRKRLCPHCMRKLEEKFAQVKEFLRNYPNSSIELVSKENDVSVRQIKQWVKEERLTFLEGGMSGITCERCGKSISTGRFCGDCKMKLGNSLMNAIDKPANGNPKKKVHEKDRMRFFQEQQKEE